jgi:hypothetical protein
VWFPLRFEYFHTLLKIVVMAGLVQFDSYTIPEARRVRHSDVLRRSGEMTATGGVNTTSYPQYTTDNQAKLASAGRRVGYV